jgi:transposase
MKYKPRDLDLSEAKRIVEGATLSDAERKILLAVIEMLVFVLQLVETKSVTIARLRKMLFGASTEKTSQICGDRSAGSTDAASTVADANKPPATDDTPKTKRKGHGRNPATRYHGAEKIAVPHPTLQPGDHCPCCEKGKVSARKPKRLPRIEGQAPIWGKLYELERLRCNTCGELFTAGTPQDAGEEKYDATTAVLIAVLKYGLGLPFYRLARLQSAVGIPLPAATQWDILSAHLAAPEAVYDELIRQAACAELVHNDDTTARVLSLMSSATSEHSPERTGMFTTGIIAFKHSKPIALFFTGRQHAGENLRDVLAHRAANLGPPIQMCDALSRNLPKDLATILANCLAHSRRRYVDVFNHFPDECRRVLETLREVYRHDATACQRQMSPQARLEWHQQQSGPLMDDLEKWLRAQFDEKLVEPNSGLGDAIGYMLDHWHALTQFLRVAGAPLDNNICERALKKAILHRKNSLFFRSEHGAHVGDVFMSLIHTAELCSENPIEYLRALMRHPKDVAARPADWLPWNYPRAVATAA